MNLSCQPTTTRHSALPRSHLQRHQVSHSSMSVSQHTCAPMPAGRVSASFSNRRQMTTNRSTSRQDPTSAQTPSHSMLSMNLNYSPSPGPLQLKYKMFLAGLPHFRVSTDHHSLIPFLNSHHLYEIENPWLHRLKTRIVAYNFTAEWLKGKNNDATDALSRNPMADPNHMNCLPSKIYATTQISPSQNSETQRTMARRV